MATPITWRNVNGPSLAEASRPFEVANHSIANGFDIFNRLLKEKEATDAANTLQIQENQKNAYLDQLATAKTPEQLAAQADTLAQMKAALSPAARAAVRTADETRLDTLYKQTKTANEFQDYSLDRAQLPITQNILSLASQGKKDEALALMKANPDLRLPAPMMDAIVKGDRDLTKFGWDQQNHLWKGQTHDLDMRVGESSLKTAASNLLTAAAQRGLISAQTAESQGRTNALALDTESKINDRKAAATPGAQLDKKYAEFIANSPLDKGTIDTQQGKENLYKALNELKLPESQKSDILYNLDKYYKEGAVVGQDEKGKPIRLPLPVSVVVDAVQGSSDNPLAIGFSRRGDDVVNILDKRFGVKSDGSKDNSLQTSKDAQLINTLMAAAKLRNDRDAALFAPPKPTPVEDGLSLKEAARKNREDTLKQQLKKQLVKNPF